jgi:hypothetical protein
MKHAGIFTIVSLYLLILGRDSKAQTDNQPTANTPNSLHLASETRAIPSFDFLSTQTHFNERSFAVTHPHFRSLMGGLASPSIPPSKAVLYSSDNFDGPLRDFLNLNLTSAQPEFAKAFGVSGIMPLAHGRVEIFGSAGGIFVPFRTRYTMPNAWFTEANLGARLALEPSHHLWAGGTVHYMADFADKTRQWGYASADLTIRFGR